MDAAFENALRTVATSYDAAVRVGGGPSLARVATVVVNSGSFFKRLFAHKTFSVGSLERFAAWFRDPANWPDGDIPADAATALASMGRPPLAGEVSAASWRTAPVPVSCDPMPVSQRERAA